MDFLSRQQLLLNLHQENQKIKDMRKLQNNIPYLSKNQLFNFVKKTSDTESFGLERCKKMMSQSIQSILKDSKKQEKLKTFPIESREKYVQLYKWLMKRLNILESGEYFQSLTPLQFIQEKKKLIISCYLEIQELLKPQCRQKSQIVKIIFTSSIHLINALLIEMENMSSQVILSQMQQSNKTESEFMQKTDQLQKQIQSLVDEKNHKWRTLQVVVKDNRILKKQNRKLLQMLNEEQWKIKVINEEHIKIKGENEKYKLLLESPASNEDQQIKIAKYMNTKAKIEQIDSIIKLYPKKAQSIALKQLKNVQLHELSTINQKIDYIIKSIQSSGQTFQQTDDIQDFFNANKKVMSFNISTQTQTITIQTGINTIDKKVQNYSTQVPRIRLSKDFSLEQMSVWEQILPTIDTYQKRGQRKGKTVNLPASIKDCDLNKSSRKIDSIKKLILQDRQLSTGFTYVMSVSMCFPQDFSNSNVVGNKVIALRRQSISSSDSESDIDKNNLEINNKNIKRAKEVKKCQQYPVRVKFHESSLQKNSNFTQDSDIQTSNRVKQRSCRQKRVSRVQNMHTLSSKLKTKYLKQVDTQNWTITRLFNLQIEKQKQNSPEINQIKLLKQQNNKNEDFGRKLTKNSKKRLTGLPSGIVKKRKFDLKQNDVDSSQNLSIIQQNLAKNRNISCLVSPQQISQRLFQTKNQSKEQSNNQLFSKNNSIEKLTKQKFYHKRHLSKDSVRFQSLKRPSVQSFTSISTANPFFEKRVFTQQSQNQQFSLLNQIKKNKSSKRLSEFIDPKQNLNSLKAKKYNRGSFVFDNQKFLNQDKGFCINRQSSFGFSGFNGNQKFKHYRTRTQGIEEIQEIAQETFVTLKNLKEKSNPITVECKTPKLQEEVLQNFTPMRRFVLTNIADLEKIDACKSSIDEKSTTADLMKSIDKIIRNIFQRSSQIMKKDYLFKEFLLSFYKLQYGGHRNAKMCTQFIKDLKNSQLSSNSLATCLNLLLNQNYPEAYRKDIFKLFTILIDKNGGSLNFHQGDHNLYKKIISQILRIFIDEQEVKKIIKQLGLSSLNGNLADYFVAAQAQISKRSLKSELFQFLNQNLLPCSESLVSFDLIKEISFFVCSSDSKIKNKLMELKIFMQSSLEVHRLCLIVNKIKFQQVDNIFSTIQKRYLNLIKKCPVKIDDKQVISALKSQKFENFPLIKQIFQRKIESFYKHNIQIPLFFLKLCRLTLFQQLIQNQFPISDCLQIINQRYEKLERFNYYKENLQKLFKIKK